MKWVIDQIEQLLDEKRRAEESERHSSNSCVIIYLVSNKENSNEKLHLYAANENDDSRIFRGNK